MRRRHYAGIFCLSLATLLLELAFTRVLAVANWDHFGFFLVIFMALLGFGASGVGVGRPERRYGRSPQILYGPPIML
jgi:hypothetical protein